MLKEAVTEAFNLYDTVLAENEPALETVETGVVTNLSDGIAVVTGLSGVKLDEIVHFPDGLLGVATTLDKKKVGITLLGDAQGVKAGDKVRRSGRVVDIPVGPALLGRVVDTVGRPMDDRGPIAARERRQIEREAHPIMNRKSVSVPLQTGLKAIDALIPIGRGQRELILGDRQTGKTAIGVDTIINQKDTGVVCIYCAVGQRASSVARVVNDIQTYGNMDNTIVVVASGESSPGLQYMAPYAATTIGEYFMENGRDVLVVYDDLTRQARSYRQMSLLLRRPPGREAFPGDIFYVHSRLLERSTRLKPEFGGGSLTALPIIETQGQNISAYIPTNVISITDGQIYLSPSLAQKGMMPAIDIGKSVSRVGGNAQVPAYRAVAGDLRLSYAQFEELEAFARFGTQLDKETQKNLTRGRTVRRILKQVQYAPMSVAEQVTVLLCAAEGVFDAVTEENMDDAEALVREAILHKHEGICQDITDGKKLTDERQKIILGVARQTLEDNNLVDHDALVDTDEDADA